MERVEHAARHYRLHCPSDLLGLGKKERARSFPQRQLQVWLDEDVRAAISELWQDERFRHHASWPLRIIRDPDCDEHQQISQLADMIRNEAESLLAQAIEASSAGRLISLQQAASAASPYCTLDGAIDTASADPRDFLAEQVRIKGVYGEYARALIALEEAARLHVEDLLKANDYFGSETEAFTNVEGEVKEIGRFVPQKLPRLRHLGNHIFRNAISRAEQAYEAMNYVRTKIFAEVPDASRFVDSIDQRQALAEVIGRATDQFLISDVARLSEACIVLVQLCTLDQRRQHDLRWLGIDTTLAAGADFRASLRLALRDYDYFERIAQALDEVQRLQLGESPKEADIRRAIEKGGLVLIGSNRTCYWKKIAIQAAWRAAHKPWEFFWLLAASVREVGGVNPEDLYPERHKVSPGTMASRWHRLEELLPTDLAACVEAIRGNRGYRLKLPRDQVSLFP